MAVAPCLSAKLKHAVLSHGFAFAELFLGSERGRPAMTFLQHCSSGTPLLGQILCRTGGRWFACGRKSRPLNPLEMMLGVIQCLWQKFYIECYTRLIKPDFQNCEQKNTGKTG